MQHSLGDLDPVVAKSAYVHPRATIIGDVTIKTEASIWPGVVLRGDNGTIKIGPRTNIQDNAICHETVNIGADVTVGHAAIIHNCTVEHGALVGMNATVLDEASVGRGAVVAAGSVVTEGTEIPPETLFAGTPASCIREEIEGQPGETAATHYVDKAKQYREGAEHECS